MHLHISATFTADLVEPALKLALNAAAVPFKSISKSYGQVLQAFQTQASDSDVIIFLIRLEDWTSAGRIERLLENVNLFLRELRTWRVGNGTAVLVCLCPPSKRSSLVPSFGRAVEAAADRLQRECESIRDCIWLDAGEQATRYGVSDWHDEYLDRLAHIPYIRIYFSMRWVSQLRVCSTLSPRRRQS